MKELVLYRMVLNLKSGRPLDSKVSTQELTFEDPVYWDYTV